MIEAINIFRAFGVYGLFTSEKINSAERRLSKELIKDARQLAKKAGSEEQNGEQAKKLMLDAGEENLRQKLAQIAIWHYETSANSYRKAAARYDEAARIQTDNKRVLRNRVEEINRLAEECEQTVRFSQNFIN